MNDPIDLAKQLQIKNSFLTREDLYRYLEETKNYVLRRSFEFHASLWSDDLKVRAKNQRYMKKHAAEFRARERSASLFLVRFGQFKDAEQPPANPRDITPESMETMGLSEDQLKQLAGIEDKEPK